VYPTANEGGGCDDGDVCTTSDVCTEGKCQGEGEPCVPDAAPDASIDAGVPDGRVDDGGTGPQRDAATRADAKPMSDVDAPETDGAGGRSDEELVPDSQPSSLYACSISVGRRSLATPLLLILLIGTLAWRLPRRAQGPLRR
jgi:hypothetical protein